MFSKGLPSRSFERIGLFVSDLEVGFFTSGFLTLPSVRTARMHTAAAFIVRSPPLRSLSRVHEKTARVLDCFFRSRPRSGPRNRRGGRTRARVAVDRVRGGRGRGSGKGGDWGGGGFDDDDDDDQRLCAVTRARFGFRVSLLPARRLFTIGPSINV